MPPPDHQSVLLHAHAPAKPAPGAPCNGCGLCCAAESCALGRLLFLRRAGPCPGLIWEAQERRYRCGVLSAPHHHSGWLPRALGPLLRLWARRWIAAGKGCDSDAEVV